MPQIIGVAASRAKRRSIQLVAMCPTALSGCGCDGIVATVPLHGRSMEAEARAILRDALATSDADDVGLGTWIARHVERVGGADLEVPAREALRDPPAFE